MLTSREQNIDAPILPRPIMDTFMKCYAPDPKSTLFNVFSEWESKGKSLFEGWPPTFFQVCGADPLRDDGLVFEKVLREEVGVKTNLKAYPGLPHGFNSFFPQLKESQRYTKDTADGLGWLLEVA